MGKIYEDVTELIGKTPILKLNRYMEELSCKAVLFGKLEAMNPAGSSKDRVGLAMILDAEKKGILKSGATIIEPTSGNTGIGLAAVAAAKGYKTVFTMPDTMSVERQMLLRAYGAEVVLTDGEKGMSGHRNWQILFQVHGFPVSLIIQQMQKLTEKVPDQKYGKIWMEMWMFL